MNPTLKAGLILIVVFAIGVMAGIASIRFSDGSRPRGGPTDDPYRQNPEVVERIEGRLVDHYGLTVEQASAVRLILKDSQEKYDAFFRETRPTFDQIRRAQQMAIRELMTPEQREKFEAWMEERRKRRDAQGDGPGRGGREGGPRPHKGQKPPKDSLPGN